jgi:hypothetical protein
VSSHYKKAAILDYWRAVELLSENPAPALPDDGATETVFAPCVGAPLPWELDQQPAALPSRRQRYQHFDVYCGLDQHGQIQRILETALDIEPTTSQREHFGNSYLFAFSADAEGRPLINTFRLGTRAWAASRSRAPGFGGADWLSGLEASTAKMAREFARRMAEDDAQLGIVSYADLLVETRCLADKLGLPELAKDIAIRIELCPDGSAFAVRKTTVSPSPATNSGEGFAKDLGRIANEVRNRDAGRGLRDYLASHGEVSEAKPVDVGACVTPLVQHLAPALFPIARWPTVDNLALPCNRQFVVNALFKILQRSGGLFSVDTPPGCEKAEVLRDMVAALVVERASRLAQLPMPEQAFIGEKAWITPSLTGVVHTLRPELRGFEIIVASSDEAALNRTVCALSNDAATALMHQPDTSIAAAAIIARIDNEAFLQQFETTTRVDEEQSETGLRGIFQTLSKTALDWNIAIGRFRNAVVEERRLRQARIALFGDFVRLGNVCQEIEAQETRLVLLGAHESATRCDLDSAQTASDIAATDVMTAETQRRNHYAQRPGFLAAIFSLGKLLYQWRCDCRSHERCLAHAEQRLMEADTRLKCRIRALSAVERERETETAILVEQRILSDSLRASQTKAQAVIDTVYPSIANLCDADATSPTPWSDPAWNKARTRVFMEGLNLHQAFIRANASRLEQNVQAAIEIVAGKVPKSASSDAVETAWASLFFLIPVLSLNLSAFTRIFSCLRRESIGWLVIDEAGDLPPQIAAGAVWRAKRTVFFGDSTQSAPAEALSGSIRSVLRKHYKVDAEWLHDETSAQQLATRTSRLGAWKTTGDITRWTGVPLGRRASKTGQRTPVTRKPGTTPFKTLAAEA